MSESQAEEFNQLGNRLQGEGAFAEAIKAYDSALALDPDHHRAWRNKGIALQRLGRIEKAIAAFEQALRLDPDNSVVMVNLALAYQAQNDTEMEIHWLRKALVLSPRDERILNSLLDHLEKSLKFKEMEELLNRLVENDPAHVLALVWLSNVHNVTNDPEKAILYARRVIELDPNNFQALFNLASIENRLLHEDEANKWLERAISACPEFPKPMLWLSTLLIQFNRLEEAGVWLEKAEASNLDALASYDINFMRAETLERLGRFDEALAVLDAAVALEPDNTHAIRKRSYCLLRHGDFAKAWEGYESRWRLPEFKVVQDRFFGPLWRGESPAELAGPLLITHEQGFGDFIQFSRYAPVLAENGYTILLETPEPLYRLYRQSMIHPRLTVIPEQKDSSTIFETTPYAAHISTMSIPRLCGTTLETVPRNVPYLRAASADVTGWQNYFYRQKEKIDVGLMRTSSLINMHNHHRSLLPEFLEPLTKIKGTKFYSLQKEPVPMPEGITPLASRLGDFADTAAAIEALDLVITIDASIAHLAGALGKKVWILLPFVAEWRWLEKGETSPWYPSVRLFRQRKAGDWTEVIERVNAELKIFMRGL